MKTAARRGPVESTWCIVFCTEDDPRIVLRSLMQYVDDISLSSDCTHVLPAATSISKSVHHTSGGDAAHQLQSSKREKLCFVILANIYITD